MIKYYLRSKLCFLKRALFLSGFLLFLVASLKAQTGSCPVNVDYESGDFLNWLCYRGSTYSQNRQNVVSVSTSSPTPGIHTIIPKGNQLDYYGQFPISSPDGSQYCVKLGNDGTGAQAEQISYTFTVPTNQNNFVITYIYAVVLQDPQHPAEDQPRFMAKVFDISTNKYIDCGSFDYVATASLPGFKRSARSNDVLYKSWTPVSINLAGYQGKQLRIEFTTADCTQGGHFGYAYVDVYKTCANLITGANYCNDDLPVLTGPSSYDKYFWYNADRSKLLGTGISLPFTVQPPEGTIINLDMIPYPGYGCETKTSAVMHKSTMSFLVNDPLPVCSGQTVDITAPGIAITAGENVRLSYWTDPLGNIPLANPKAIGINGTYYIQATTIGCNEIKPVNVTVLQQPVVKITNPPLVCDYSSIDLTASTITAGSTLNLTFTYWKDINATIPLPNPAAVKVAGTYYIKGELNICSSISPVIVDFFPSPVLNLTPPQAVCFPNTVSITGPEITTGSDANLIYSYWTDVNATQAISNPTQIGISGTYYVKAVNSNGCQSVKPVVVTINPLPKLVITNPPDVCIPNTVDLSDAAVTAGSSDVNKLTYWKDAAATIALSKFNAVADSGVYYIKATTSLGCETISSVLVTIHQLPVIKITPPRKIYQPGTVDITAPAIVAGSSPDLKFTYYNDIALMSRVTDPKAVKLSGIYYIRGENEYGCFGVGSVEVVVAKVPNILVPTAFTPTQLDNNRLYPFLIGIKNFTIFKVYNKWGNLIYETTDPSPDKGWNGFYRGSMQFLETYSWMAEGYDYVGNLVHRSGNTILMK